MASCAPRYHTFLWFIPLHVPYLLRHQSPLDLELVGAVKRSSCMRNSNPSLSVRYLEEHFSQAYHAPIAGSRLPSVGIEHQYWLAYDILTQFAQSRTALSLPPLPMRCPSMLQSTA